MRDYKTIPLRKLRKRELRALVVDMRLRHHDEICAARTTDATIPDGPVHVLDSGRYFAAVHNGVPVIFRADTTGAVLLIEKQTA